MKDGPQSFSESFVARLTDAQFGLFNYISFLLGDSADARDVLQETNLDLWRKASTYDEEQPFLPWARAIAYYQVLTFRKKQSRDRLLFDDELLETMAAQPSGEDEEQFARLSAFLKECRGRLNEFQRAVLAARYEERRSLGEIAQERRCSVPAVGMSLMRIREALGHCLRSKLAEERA